LSGALVNYDDDDDDDDDEHYMGSGGDGGQGARAPLTFRVRGHEIQNAPSF